MTIVRFERHRLASTPWMNGGGRTREIVRMPPNSDMNSFDWRASIAEISADGPFSTFAGFDRVIALLDGDGVNLRSTDGSIDHRLDAPLAPFAFAGESAIEATLIGRASNDFNVMVRRAAMRVDMRIVVARETLAECSAGVLFAARGEWDARTTGGARTSYTLPSNSGLWWDDDLLAWEIVPRMREDALIVVRVT